MKFDKSRLVTWLLLLFILVTLFNIYILVKDRDRIYQNISTSLYQKLVQQIHQPEDGKDGYTPVKGTDYFDGINGQDGKDGLNGSNGRDGIDGEQGIQGEKGDPGQDGYTPRLRCNTAKNRWEVRYTDDGNWELLNNEKVKCTIGL